MSELERPAPAAFAAAKFFAAATLIGSFVAVVRWFDAADFYHRHFFDHGAIVAVNNAMRVVFVGIFAWLIYAPGAAVVALIASPRQRAALWPAERAVLGFAFGACLWHIAMLILGFFDLYYRSIIAGLSLVVVVASSRHFSDVAVAGCRAFAVRIAQLRRRRVSPQEIGVAAVVIVASWLLLQRALFPGGGHDYYTHYFYYYLAVLKNHGLAMNEAWYHYYYDKGNGLIFAGMLLTDPEAPALTNFCCVLFAALAIATFAVRLAPGSAWPVAGVLIYLLYYLIGFDSSYVEGELQKNHEEIAALIVMFLWAVCLERRGPALPFQLMAAATAVTAAVITQPVGILLGLFAGLLCVSFALRRRWREMWSYAAIGAASTAAVLAVYVWNYLQTGLASDQPISPMLYFADFTRLDRLGLIPMVIVVAWIRDNYGDFAQSSSWAPLKDLAHFMRLQVLWPLLLGPAVAALVLRVSAGLDGRRPVLVPDAAAATLANAAVVRLGVFLGLFAVIALVFGRDQSASFTRLSTLVVPVIVMAATAGCAWLFTARLRGRRDPWTWTALPIVLLLAVMATWQGKYHWSRPLPKQTANALRFLSGRFSLADAYRHAGGGYPFGGINPAAFAAARQLPYGTPIWSTNVASYCIVPGCLIESVVSFKMSGRLDDVLGGDPDLARRRLQEAGLNYFLFMKDRRLLDLLPFSRLFAPDTIGRYLGVQWTDGSTYLLTWIGPQTSPLGPDFLDAYMSRRAEPDPSRWFRFEDLAQQLVIIAPRLRTVTRWGAARQLLTWRHLR